MADYVAGSVSNREFFVMSSVSMSSDGDFVPRTAYNEMKAERDRLQNLVDQLKLETAFLKASQPVSAAAELSCRDPPQAQGQPVAKRICVPLEVASISSLSSSSCPAVAVPRPTILSNDVDLNKVFRDMCKGPEGKPETYNRKEYHLVVHLVRAGSVDTGVHTYPSTKCVSCWQASYGGVKLQCYCWGGGGAAKSWCGDGTVDIRTLADAASKIAACGWCQNPRMQLHYEVAFNKHVDDDSQRLESIGDKWDISRYSAFSSTKFHSKVVYMEIEYPTALNVQGLQELLQTMPADVKTELQN
eukprot:TRINITY_DN3870_c0_g2_i1.p1 TRINITY_DN3870_c0_g2~~TRINITY_DN3870_c0_g2_i1.p1  ORF type:complete len:301 (-),score=40.50 TRINITY_DN3870_c0_g2_i1:510-1412(-)